MTQALKNGNSEEAKRLVAWYKEVYGIKNFFLEITHHPEIDGHEVLMKKIVALSKETDTPLVAAHDVYYLHPEDKKARDTLMLVNTSGDFSDRNSDSSEEDFSFISSGKAEELFQDTPEALANTLKIAEKCELELTLGSWVFPDFKIEDGKTPDEKMRELVYLGFDRLKIEKNKEEKTQLHKHVAQVHGGHHQKHAEYRCKQAHHANHCKRCRKQVEEHDQPEQDVEHSDNHRNRLLLALHREHDLPYA